jgi:hypothetical protein
LDNTVDMKHNDLIKIFCKAFGLYFAIQAIVNIKDAILTGVGIPIFGEGNSSMYFFLSIQIFNVAFNSIAAWLLITKADLITSKIIRDTEDKTNFTTTKTDLIELVVIAISGLVIIDSMPEILNKLTHYIYFNPNDRIEKNEFWTSNNKANLMYSIFKLAVGLVTIANGRLISRWLTKIGDKSDKIESGEN